MTDSLDQAPWPDDEVRVWQVELGPDPNATTGAWRVLSREERAAAEDLRDPLDRARKVQTRAALRQILARALDQDPHMLVIDVGAEGKPEVTGGDGRGRVHFNVSHSGSRALIAVSGAREVGVDIELVRDIAWRAVARSFFSPGEIDDLDAAAPERQIAEFFDCWVRKEAYVKALGTGLRRRTADFRVPLGSAGGVVDDSSRSDDGAWYVRPLDLGPEWSAALAVADRNVHASVRAWSEQYG